MDAGPATGLPLRVMLLDKLLGRFDHVARQRNPVEVRDDEPATWHQQTPRFQRCRRAVEPVPTLTRRDDVEAAIRQARGLGGRNHITKADAGIAVEPARFVEQRSGWIEPGHVAAAAREAARQRPGAGAEIEDTLTRHTDAERGEPVQKSVRKPSPMAAVVLGRLAEVDLEGAGPGDR